MQRRPSVYDSWTLIAGIQTARILDSRSHSISVTGRVVDSFAERGLLILLSFR
jgi:hypothetical protein